MASTLGTPQDGLRLERSRRLTEVVQAPDRGLRLTRAAVRRAGDERMVTCGSQADLDVELQRQQVPRPAFVEVDLANQEQRLLHAAAGEDVVRPQAHLPPCAGGEAAPIGDDTEDAGPPVEEMIRLGEEAP